MSMSEQNKKDAMLKASEMTKDFDPEKAELFMAEHTDKDWASDFGTLLRMLTTQEYSLSPATWAVLAGALAYVICPIDVIPDFIPIVGWLDDAFVLGVVMTMLKNEIAQFSEFLGKKQA